MNTGAKLAIVGLVVVAATAYMAYLGAASSWQYYATVDECLTNSAELMRGRIRVNGQIVGGSLQISDDRRNASFALAGSVGQLRVDCQGTLPDNLREGGDVVVEGRLAASGKLRGEKLLTRCASKYQSRSPSATAAVARGDRSEARR